MAKLPWPPDAAGLARRLEPMETTLPAGTQLRRIYFQGGRHPTTWDAFRHTGPLSGARFDHHQPPVRNQARAVLYCADLTKTCLGEVFQTTRTVNRRRHEPWLTVFEINRPVTLLDLCGDWPTRAGASQAINSGPRDRSRAWSRTAYEAWTHIEGLRYRSSMHARGLAYVLFERAQPTIPSRPLIHLALEHPGLDAALRRAAAQLGYRVL